MNMQETDPAANLRPSFQQHEPPMSKFTLVIGNKAYSSWSLRAWLALKMTGAPFDEIVIALSRPETYQKILTHSPSGRVPALLADGMTVWDSLAILEFLAERFPEAGLWPADPIKRALARSISAEMHAGFAPLRRHMPMDLKQRRPGLGRMPAVFDDIARITEIWRGCRARYGGPSGQGPFLFGRFTNADAMFAPVATRFVTYEVPLDEDSQAYVDAIVALPAMAEWTEAAIAEPWVVDFP